MAAARRRREPAATGASYASGAGDPEEVTFTYPGPVATVSPAKLTFGEQPQQTVSAPKSVTITNTGVGPLYLYGLTFEGADESDFLAGAGSCLGPVEEGASCKVSVRFDPQGEHARTAKLVIAGNTGEAPKTVELEGTGGHHRPHWCCRSRRSRRGYGSGWRRAVDHLRKTRRRKRADRAEMQELSVELADQVRGRRAQACGFAIPWQGHLRDRV